MNGGKILGTLVLAATAVIVLMWTMDYCVIRKDYNHGICPKCGTKLKHYNTTRDNYREYECSSCGFKVPVWHYTIDKPKNWWVHAGLKGIIIALVLQQAITMLLQ